MLMSGRSWWHHDTKGTVAPAYKERCSHGSRLFPLLLFCDLSTQHPYCLQVKPLILLSVHTVHTALCAVPQRIMYTKSFPDFGF